MPCHLFCNCKCPRAQTTNRYGNYYPHSVTINNTPINYTAKTGTQPVWDEVGRPTAYLHYTYYTRNNVKDRFEFKGYRSGHMMYLSREDLQNANNDIRAFIKRTTNGASAKY